MMETVVLTARIYKEGGLFVAECLEIGTSSQGARVEEAVANLKEATELYLEEFPRAGVGPAASIKFKVRMA